MFRLNLLPKETKFFDLFEGAAANLLEASRALKNLTDDYIEIDAKVKLITELEHRGDGFTHRIMEQLHSTFITPLEREDIVNLTRSLDDVVDFIESAADTMQLYKVEQPTESARALADIIVRVGEEINSAMPRLRGRDNMRKILGNAVEINRLENEADELMRAGVAQLLERPDQVMEFIRWREMYELLESATDRGEDVANSLEAIVLKHS